MEAQQKYVLKRLMKRGNELYRDGEEQREQQQQQQQQQQTTTTEQVGVK